MLNKNYCNVNWYFNNTHRNSVLPFELLGDFIDRICSIIPNKLITNEKAHGNHFVHHIHSRLSCFILGEYSDFSIFSKLL